MKMIHYAFRWEYLFWMGDTLVIMTLFHLQSKYDWSPQEALNPPVDDTLFIHLFFAPLEAASDHGFPPTCHVNVFGFLKTSHLMK